MTLEEWATAYALQFGMDQTDSPLVDGEGEFLDAALLNLSMASAPLNEDYAHASARGLLCRKFKQVWEKSKCRT